MCPHLTNFGFRPLFDLGRPRSHLDPTLCIPFLDPNPAISDSWIPIHIAGKIPRSGGAVWQDLDMGHPQLMPLKM